MPLQSFKQTYPNYDIWRLLGGCPSVHPPPLKNVGLVCIGLGRSSGGSGGPVAGPGVLGGLVGFWVWWWEFWVVWWGPGKGCLVEGPRGLVGVLLTWWGEARFEASENTECDPHGADIFDAYATTGQALPRN